MITCVYTCGRALISANQRRLSNGHLDLQQFACFKTFQLYILCKYNHTPVCVRPLSVYTLEGENCKSLTLKFDIMLQRTILLDLLWLVVGCHVISDVIREHRSDRRGQRPCVHSRGSGLLPGWCQFGSSQCYTRSRRTWCRSAVLGLQGQWPGRTPCRRCRPTLYPPRPTVTYTRYLDLEL